ncbi:hypothetical protein NP233_g10702 [Leucocoprinus birnbaumii]|uniref:Uncharacterized protein n=1 Tax=Leucocoprinus birnbaumii TaxID=56174 RepID=A0AAD5VLH5_9AGAR|nr:hypothetical protein NP233_g10702 [Leucocoprinus birnbaumii]
MQIWENMEYEYVGLNDPNFQPYVLRSWVREKTDVDAEAATKSYTFKHMPLALDDVKDLKDSKTENVTDRKMTSKRQWGGMTIMERRKRHTETISLRQQLKMCHKRTEILVNKYQILANQHANATGEVLPSNDEELIDMLMAPEA